LLFAPTAEAADMMMKKPLTIRSVKANRTELPVYGRATLKVALDATYQNPFDAEEVRLDAVVSLPGGGSLRVPGFYYQNFRTVHVPHENLGKAERLERVGEPHWLIRYTPTVPGVHHLVIEANDASGTVRSKPMVLKVAEADVPGMVRLPKDKAIRYFVTDRGESFYPIGFNIYGAPGHSWVEDMERWLGKMGENGCNFARIWMYYMFFRWSEPGHKGPPPYDHIDLGWAWRYDRVMEAAEKNGIYVQLCLDTHHPFLASKGSGLEKIGFYNKHGGPLSHPGRIAPDLFTNPQCRKAYRDKLRYVAARYGSSPNLFAWEFWNEVGCLPGAGNSQPQIRAWHSEMTRFLRAVDPWNHLITSSSGTGYTGTDIDFDQPHIYGAADSVRSLDGRRWRPGQRRMFWGEAFPLPSRGYPHPSPVPQAIQIDPQGRWIHEYCFASPGLGQSATPMSWYHISYIEKQDLFSVYKPFSKWIAGFDFAGQRAAPFGGREATAEPRGLLVLGVRGQTESLVWIQNRTSGWAWQANRRKGLKPVEAATVTLRGIAEGDWLVELWDTTAGVVTTTRKLSADGNGVLQIPVGPVENDLALRIRREENAKSNQKPRATRTD
jgi:hypothetical protein